MQLTLYPICKGAKRSHLCQQISNHIIVEIKTQLFNVIIMLPLFFIIYISFHVIPVKHLNEHGMHRFTDGHNSYNLFILTINNKNFTTI